MTKLPETGSVDTLSDLLKQAGLNKSGRHFDPHWGDSPGWFVHIHSGVLTVSRAEENSQLTMRFDTLEEADAWVLACWRMK
jgi:hypothetical protein